MGRPRESIESKFWSKVKIGKSEDDCWEWTASKFVAGYGQLTHGDKMGEKFTLKAHRVSYELNVGEIPDGILVCHTCDNPSCANPKHLFLGTWKDNVQDMISKGRRADTAGEKNGMSKITQEIADKIRKEYLMNDPDLGRYHRKSLSQAKLGEMYGISQKAVCKILRGEMW